MLTCAFLQQVNAHNYRGPKVWSFSLRCKHRVLVKAPLSQGESEHLAYHPSPKKCDPQFNRFHGTTVPVPRSHN